MHSYRAAERPQKQRATAHWCAHPFAGLTAGCPLVSLLRLRYRSGAPLLTGADDQPTGSRRYRPSPQPTGRASAPLTAPGKRVRV